MLRFIIREQILARSGLLIAMLEKHNLFLLTGRTNVKMDGSVREEKLYFNPTKNRLFEGAITPYSHVSRKHNPVSV